MDPGPEIVVWDESLRPVRELTYALDVSGNLQLGGSLEEKLAMAAGENIMTTLQFMGAYPSHKGHCQHHSSIINASC